MWEMFDLLIVSCASVEDAIQIQIINHHLNNNNKNNNDDNSSSSIYDIIVIILLFHLNPTKLQIAIDKTSPDVGTIVEVQMIPARVMKWRK